MTPRTKLAELPHDHYCPCFPGVRPNSLTPIPTEECVCNRARALAYVTELEAMRKAHDVLVRFVAQAEARGHCRPFTQ